ncbi:MAG: hypothetical protein Q9175_003428 [Cornicularia normoerica]
MPAMSPTMTEGNIASWKVHEGDSFSIGDVLLEIETDKTQMDVEAQDDGIMAKIMQEAGSKGVKVGTQIAVLAATDDDLSTLTLPAEESALTSSPYEDIQSGIDASTSSKPQAAAPPSSKAEDSPPIKILKPPTPSTSSGKHQEQRYPLYPSVTQLLHENSLSSSEADKIRASGPKGRLLKGDVLGYLGRISSTYSFEQSTRINKLGHLDLSNVKPAPSKAMAPSQPSKAQAQKAPGPEVEPTDTEVAIPICLSPVISVQRRIQATLGVTLPLSTFIARATELANDDLPRSAATKQTADDLFNDVLGLDNVSTKTSRGMYMPQITALPTKPLMERARPRRQPDIYNILIGTPSTTPSTTNTGMPPPGITAGSKTGESTNVFSVSAAKGEEKRARVFLERVKTLLQVEPGRLVI